MLGKTIQERRKTRGLTQTDLSRLSGVPQTTISGWERGFKPRAADLHKVARALCCTIEELLGYETAATPATEQDGRG